MFEPLDGSEKERGITQLLVVPCTCPNNCGKVWLVFENPLIIEMEGRGLCPVVSITREQLSSLAAHLTELAVQS